MPSFWIHGHLHSPPSGDLRPPSVSTHPLISVLNSRPLTLLAIPGTPIQAPAMPIHPAGTPKGPEPNLSRRYQPNVKRIRQKETDVPVSDYHSSDEDDEDTDSVRGEELDNCPPDLTKVEGVRNNGPRSIKTVSRCSLSTSTPRTPD